MPAAGLSASVAQQFQTATAQQTSVFYLQLEFNGLARIGSNPLEVLRRNIPGYSLINQSMPDRRTDDFGDLGRPGRRRSAVGTRCRSDPSGTPRRYGTYD